MCEVVCGVCVCDCEAWVRSLCVYEGVWGVCEGVCVECVCVCVCGVGVYEEFVCMCV